MLAKRPRTGPAETQPTTVLRKGTDGRLWQDVEEGTLPVTVHRCFPWLEPGRYLSLRDDDGAEVALVAETADLDPASRVALETALAEAGFLLEVTGFDSVEEEVEIRHWCVRTQQGPRTLQTRLEEWPRALPAGGYLIRDLAGDLYRIPEPETLDAASQAVFWPYVD